MANYSGFIYIASEPHFADLVKRILSGDTPGGDYDEEFPEENDQDGDPRRYRVIKPGFSDSLSSGDWKPRDREICLICVDSETISYVALARRGSKSTTGKYRVHFDYVVPIKPIIFQRILAKIPNRYHRYLLYSASGTGGRIPFST